MRPVLIRAPNHLGDLLMALPAIRSLQPAEVLLPRWLMPIAELAGLEGEAIPFDRGAKGLLAAAGEVRRRGYGRGVLLAPSFSAALLFVLGGVAERRGARTDGRGLLITEPVPDQSMAGLHRSATYHVLARGQVPEPLPAPSLVVPPHLLAAWEALWAEHMHAHQDAGEPFLSSRRPAVSPSVEGAPASTQVGPASSQSRTIGIFPGSNAPSRRWDTERFAQLAGRIAAAGGTVVVFGGAGERPLTAQVALGATRVGGSGAAFDAGGRTDLALLAAGLASCDLLVTNDSGPMHLAAAVGTPTVSLQGASDPTRTRPLGHRHVLLQHPELPCVPCVRNECPRHGRGTVLPEAQRECLALISVDEVESALPGALTEVDA